MTTPSQAKLAITDLFVTEWADRTPYTKDNEEFKPDDIPTWVRLTIRHTGGNQETLGKKGNRKYERRGIITVSVFTPIETGTYDSDILSKAAQDIFEGENFGGVVVNDTNIREIGANDKWYQVLMEANFHYNELK